MKGQADRDLVLVQALGAIVAMFAVVGPVYGIMVGFDYPRAASALAVALTALSLLSVVLSASGVTPRLVPWLTASAVVGAMALEAYANLRNLGQFGTDELLFDYVAAKAIAAWRNPYAVPSSVYLAYLTSRVPVQISTPTVAGGFTASYDYTPLEALLMLPTALWGVNYQLVAAAVTASVVGLLLYAYRDRPYLAPLAVSVPGLSGWLAGFTSGGNLDAPWVALMAASLMTLDRDFLSGALLGLSLSFKQDPLLMLPVVAAVKARRGGARSALRLLGAASAVLAGALAPFLATAPIDTLRGVLAPGSAIPLGLSSGFIGVAQGLQPRLASVIYVAAWACLGFAAYLLYPYVGDAALSLIVLTFLPYPRGLLNYYYFPALLLAAVAPSITRGRPAASRVADLKAAAIVAGVTVAVVALPALGVALSRLPGASAAPPVKVVNVTWSDPLGVSGTATSAEVYVYYAATGLWPRCLNVTWALVLNAGPNQAANPYLWYPLNGTVCNGLNKVTLAPASPEYYVGQGREVEVVILLAGGYSATWEGVVGPQPRFPTAWPLRAFEVRPGVTAPIGWGLGYLEVDNVTEYGEPANGTTLLGVSYSGPGEVYVCSSMDGDLLRYYDLDYYLYPPMKAHGLPPLSQAWPGAVPNGSASLSVIYGGADVVLVPSVYVSSPVLAEAVNSTYVLLVPPSGELYLYGLLTDLGLPPAADGLLCVTSANAGVLLAGLSWGPAGGST